MIEVCRIVTSDHPRNTEAMRASPRCGAKTRAGTACQSPAVSGKARCRMHGGSKGSGAPRGNQNALKHGEYSAESNQFKEFLREVAKRARQGLE